MLEFGEQAALLVLTRGEVGRVAQALDSSALAVAELLGHVDHHVDELVATCAAFAVGETLATQAQYLAGLGAGGYLETRTSADSGYLDRAAEYGSRQVKHQIIYDVGSVAYEFGMLELLDDHE